MISAFYKNGGVWANANIEYRDIFEDIRLWEVSRGTKEGKGRGGEILALKIIHDLMHFSAHLMFTR